MTSARFVKVDFNGAKHSLSQHELGVCVPSVNFIQFGKQRAGQEERKMIVCFPVFVLKWVI